MTLKEYVAEGNQHFMIGAPYWALNQNPTGNFNAEHVLRDGTRLKGVIEPADEQTNGLLKLVKHRVTFPAKLTVVPDKAGDGAIAVVFEPVQD